MSDFKWSDEQKLAINTVDNNVLLSAGAGSGKTAVLTERIYQLVKKGADLNRFLILTFTNAASAEMKKRIREAIEKDKSLGDLSSKIESAHIETFDSFALFLVKKYAFRLGVSPNIQILDQTLMSIQRNKIRDNLITYLYQSKNSDFLDLISTYCVKNDNQIRSFINELCQKYELSDDKQHFFDETIKQYFNEDRISSIIDTKYKTMVEAINSAIKKAELLEDLDDAHRIIVSLEDLLERGIDYDSLTSLVDTYSFPPKKPKSISNTDVRNDIKNSLFKVLIKQAEFGTKQEITEQYLSTKKHVETLLNIVKQIEEELDKFKKEKSSYSFGDVASLALKALSYEDIRKEMSEFFQFILVDEYQDTSLIQESVINALGRNNVCMVGDIKQSIYRFRLADCKIFKEKQDLYHYKGGGQVINLNTSYRSRREIVDVVNEMFEYLMTPETNPIDYKDGHQFGFGLTDYDSLIDSKEDYKLKVYKYFLKENERAHDVETRIIADDIIYKINNKYKVFDKDSGKLRDCDFRDFAIIVDRGTKFDYIKSILSDYEIPVRVVYNEPVRDSAIVQVLKNLLIIYDSIQKENYDDKFKHAFVSISRSFIYQTKDEEIYNYIKDETILDSSLINQMKSIVIKTSSYPLYEKMNTIIEKFDIYRKINTLKHFSSNANKIELFVNLAKNMDGLGIGIDGLISYLEDLNNFDLEIDYSDKDVSENSVTLITIHRSKGLEYPIVYMPGLTSKFNTSNNTAFLMDFDYGPILPITGNNAKSSLFNHLIKVKETRENFEERLRLFYVAVTRARERLILLYQEKEKGDPLIMDSTSVSSFRSIVHYLGLEYKYGVDYEFHHEKLAKKADVAGDMTISLQNISVSEVEVARKRASKETGDIVDDGLLEFGSEIHYLLEIADYETKDSSYIKDTRMRKYINNVLTSKLFKNVKNNQVLREFAFFDEVNGVNGVIDCLLMKEDEVTIIDFKLKNLDDDKYVLQLHTYRDYIKQITSLPIKMYLISAITGEVKEIE